MSDLSLPRVFVYGTLKPGGRYYPDYCEGRVVAQVEAIAHGTLYDLPLGYPAMTPGQGVVHGYVLTFYNQDALTALDTLEDYAPNRPALENEYVRQPIEVFRDRHHSLGWAWAYIMSIERVTALGGVYLQNGRWPG